MLRDCVPLCFAAIVDMVHLLGDCLVNRYPPSQENILLLDDKIKVADYGSCRGIYSKPPYTEYISTRWYGACPPFLPF
jgi:hypothetical protein